MTTPFTLRPDHIPPKTCSTKSRARIEEKRDFKYYGAHLCASVSAAAHPLVRSPLHASAWCLAGEARKVKDIARMALQFMKAGSLAESVRTLREHVGGLLLLTIPSASR